MTFPLNTEKTHKIFMHHLGQNFRSLPAQTPVPETWQPTGVSNKTSQMKRGTVPTIPMPFWSPPTFPTWVNSTNGPRFTSSHIKSQKISRIHSILFIFIASVSAQTFTFSSLSHYTETSQMALGFHSLQLQPHFNSAAKVIFLKQNLIMLLPCLESLSSG